MEVNFSIPQMAPKRRLLRGENETNTQRKFPWNFSTINYFTFGGTKEREINPPTPGGERLG